MNSIHYFLLNRQGLARAAKQAGYTVHVAAVPDDEASLRQLEAEGFYFHPLPLCRQGFGPFGTLKTLRRLIQIIREVQPAIVHSLTIKPVILSGFICQFLRQPMVALIPGRGCSFSGSLLTRTLAQLLYKWSLRSPQTEVCFQNAEDHALFLQAGLVQSKRSRLIPGSGVDMAAFPFSPYPEKKRGPRVITLASRMLRQKGILDFLAAVPLVRERFPGTIFRLVGAPDLGNPHSFQETELRQLCSQYAVQYLGFCREIRQRLQETDLFCLPTYYGEGIPMTLMQAAALGKAIVCTDVPGCREVIQHEKTGLLVRPKDPNGLAEALCRLLAEPSFCTQLTQAAQQRLEQHFEAGIIHEQYLRLYRELCPVISTQLSDECAQTVS